MVVAISTFFISLLGIASLFALKYREQKLGRVYCPAWRDLADEKAIGFKQMLERRRRDLELLPPIMALLARKAVHEMALSFAAFARYGEGQAHKLADFVSHKHRFERRAPRSQFLMRVAERHQEEKIGGIAEVSMSGTPTEVPAIAETVTDVVTAPSVESPLLTPENALEVSPAPVHVSEQETAASHQAHPQMNNRSHEKVHAPEQKPRRKRKSKVFEDGGQSGRNSGHTQ